MLVNITTFYGEKWNDDQLQDCAELIYPEYYYIRLSDWVIFSKRAKSGKFGKVFGKLNPGTIMNWLEEFAIEWMKVSIEISEGGNLGRISNPEVSKRLGLN